MWGQSTVSFFRRMERWKAIPMTGSSTSAKRMVVNGIAISSTPALGVHGGLGGEDAVPVPVGAVEAFIREEGVVLGPERADLKDVAVSAVEVGVERDDHPVVLADAAAAVEDDAAYAVGFGIEEREPEVERVVVVGDPHLGPLAGGRAVHRVALPEAG